MDSNRPVNAQGKPRRTASELQGPRIVTPPSEGFVNGVVLHASFIFQWLHFDAEHKRDVPHFHPDSACIFCSACGYHRPRCYGHIGLWIKWYMKPVLLKITDTAILYNSEVNGLDDERDLLGRSVIVSRMTKSKSGPQRIRLDNTRERLPVKKELSFDLAEQVRRVYRVEAFERPLFERERNDGPQVFLNGEGK